MRFVHERSEVVVRRYVRIEDGPTVRHPQRSDGSTLKVVRIEVHYVMAGKSWEIAETVSGFGCVAADGLVLGPLGQPTGETWRGFLPTTSWPKLSALLDGMRPAGSPEIPFGSSETPFDPTEVR